MANAAKKKQTYAQYINSKLNKSKKDIVSIEERLQDLLTSNPEFAKNLANKCKVFAAKHTEIRTWEDLRLPKANMYPMMELMIAVKYQRELNGEHLERIIDKFAPMVVQTLSVYVNKDSTTGEETMNVWDGQHTVMALYIIAKYVLKIENLDELMVPVAIYTPKDMVELRRAFIELNDDARSPFDNADHHRQEVMAYRIDNCTKYEMAHKKQEALEEVGMFVTAKKYGDIAQPGAFSNLSDFYDEKQKVSINVHKGFTRWVLATCGDVDCVTRTSQGIESYQVYDFLKLCEAAGIKFWENDFQYVKDVVEALNVAYNGDFNPQAVQDRAIESHDAYYTQMAGTEEHGVKYDRKIGDVHFMIAQLRHALPNHKMPAFKPDVRGQWPVPVEDVQ